jgi:DNA invertase Pin-like site-specific DNA recombinase
MAEKRIVSNMTNVEKKAVIYCRVSSTAQTTRGDGLGSQKTRCMEFARARGYTVVETFSDDMTGKLIDRPGMKAMLSYMTSPVWRAG